jgi:hypothetical protein
MTRIFISYRRKDSLAIVGRIFERLENYFGPNSIFMDIDTIPPGGDFRVILENAVANANLVLAIIGENWVDARDEVGRRLDDPNDFVRIELELALSRAITKMPRAGDLPKTLAQLPYLNATLIDPGRDFVTHIDRLASYLENNAGIVRSAPAKRSSDVAVELARFDAIKNSTDPLDFRDFIDRHPNGNMIDIARRRLQELEIKHWNLATEKVSQASIEAFLAIFPDGIHAAEATKYLGRFARREADLKTWDGGINISFDVEEVRAYLCTDPLDSLATEARKRIQVLERTDSSNRLWVKGRLLRLPCLRTKNSCCPALRIKQ